MSTTKRTIYNTQSPNAKPVLWLCYDKRDEQVQCLVRKRLWFEARAQGASDLGIDRQYVEAVTWKVANDVTIPKNRLLIHPGILIRDAISELGISMLILSVRSGIALSRLMAIVSGELRVTADSAVRLAKVLGTTAEYWLNLQMTVDLYKRSK